MSGCAPRSRGTMRRLRRPADRLYITRPRNRKKACGLSTKSGNLIFVATPSSFQSKSLRKLELFRRRSVHALVQAGCCQQRPPSSAAPAPSRRADRLHHHCSRHRPAPRARRFAASVVNRARFLLILQCHAGRARIRKAVTPPGRPQAAGCGSIWYLVVGARLRQRINKFRNRRARVDARDSPGARSSRVLSASTP